MFTVHLQRAQSCTILAVQGEFTEIAVRSFQKQIAPLLQEPTSLVINLEHCTYISSAALRALLTIQQAVRSENKRLCLAQPAPFIQHILKITGIAATISVYATLEKALQACQEN